MNEQQQQALMEGLGALAATTRHASAGRHVEASLLAEMSRVHGMAASARRSSTRSWLALAAALTLACASGIWVAQRAVDQAAEAMRSGGFVPIPAAAYLPPMESGAIVRVELPLSALPSYGIQILPDMQADAVDADLLVAQDGLARGIRLVNLHASRSTP